MKILTFSVYSTTKKPQGLSVYTRMPFTNTDIKSFYFGSFIEQILNKPIDKTPCTAQDNMATVQNNKNSLRLGAARLLMSIILLMFMQGMALGQTTIWNEDFEGESLGATQGDGSYQNGYPDQTPSSWDWSVVNGTGMSVENWSGDKRMGHNPGIWNSAVFDISSYSNVSVTMDLYESGTLEATDYIRCYYRLNETGAFQLFYDASDDFSSAIATISNLNGNKLEIRVEVDNGSSEDHAFDDVVILGTSTVPTLSVTPTSLDLGYVANGNTSAEQTYVLSGTLLSPASGDITVTAPAGFEVSKTTGTGFSSSVTVPYSGSALGNTTIYTHFIPTGSPTDYTGSISNTGGGATQKDVAVTGTSILSYCNSNFTNVSYEFVTNVNFAGINKNSAGTTGGPVNYTNLVAQVVQGSTYTISVSIDPDANDYIFGFFDWNQNGALNDAGEVYTIATNTSNAGPHTLNITVPSGATIGAARMRIMVDWNNANPDPCRNATYGEAEDYTVNIQPSCSNATLTLTSVAGSDAQTVCNNTPITNITYAIGGDATGATVSGLSNGVSSSFSAGVLTISGSPTANVSYTVTTTGTPASCNEATANGSITVNALPTFSTSYADITCFGAGDGKITITVDNASGSYNYSLDNGDTYPYSGTSPKIIPALSPGDYKIRVIDGNGCESPLCPIL